MEIFWLEFKQKIETNTFLTYMFALTNIVRFHLNSRTQNQHGPGLIV